MDKTLSQDEVDALLQAIKSGEVAPEEEKESSDAGEDVAVSTPAAEVKVVSYNFRKPHLVSRDQLRGFQLLHESFAKSLQGSLLANLKTPLEIKPIAIDNLSYGEYVLSLSDPTYVAILGVSPGIGELALEINLAIVLSMVDILLGGDGMNVTETRELTAIEQSIASSFLEYILAELQGAWSSTADLTFKAQHIESNPEYVRITTPEASVLSATFDLRCGQNTGMLSVCYPFEVIQPILGRVTARMGGRREKAASRTMDREEVLKTISVVPLPIRAEYGTCRILASQLGELQLGDVLCLDTRTDSPVKVFVGPNTAYTAELGVRRGRNAVRLLRRCTEDDENGSASAPGKQTAPTETQNTRSGKE